MGRDRPRAQSTLTVDGSHSKRPMRCRRRDGKLAPAHEVAVESGRGDVREHGSPDPDLTRGGAARRPRDRPRRVRHIGLAHRGRPRLPRHESTDQRLREHAGAAARHGEADGLSEHGKQQSHRCRARGLEADVGVGRRCRRRASGRRHRGRAVRRGVRAGMTISRSSSSPPGRRTLPRPSPAPPRSGGNGLSSTAPRRHRRDPTCRRGRARRRRHRARASSSAAAVARAVTVQHAPPTVGEGVAERPPGPGPTRDRAARGGAPGSSARRQRAGRRS